MPLNADDLKFLKSIIDRLGQGDPVMAKLPLSPRIQSLIDRGYLRTVRLFVGPTMADADEPGLRFTEAGQEAFDSICAREV